MNLRETSRLAFEALMAHKSRSILTMLGMIIGVFAVIVLVSIGHGAKMYVQDQFQSLGTNLIVIQPGKTDRKSSFGPPPGSSARKLTLADVTALEKKAFNLDAVSGLVLATAAVRYQDAVGNVSIFGANDRFIDIITITIAQGSFFTREEDDSGRRVAILGSKIVKDLFGADNALGHVVKLNESEFRVIGIMAPMGQKLGLDLDQFAIIPTRAAMCLFNEDKLFGIRARASSRVGIDDAVEEVKTILKERHNGEEDFTIITQVNMLESMNTILDMLTYALAAIAAISMLVGGIGIMNIMLVSVAERTPEIGIRRAVGARRRDIMMQFLAEAVTVSVASGLLGIALAYLLSFGIGMYLSSFDMSPPNWILVPAFLLSVVVGVLFGLWPARKAAKIETLAALRYE